MTPQPSASPLPVLSAGEVAAILKEDLTSFIEASFYELNPGQKLLVGPHIEVIATKLEQVRAGKVKRLIVNLPPRHLKSHCVTVAFVAFLLGHDPARHVICASYGQDLSDELAAKCRRVMQSHFYRALFGNILGGKQSVSDYGTAAGGRRLATSVGGVLTGRGADLIILDDPQKADDALSETHRKTVNTWYDNTLLSRLNDKTKGAIVIVMQRLHQDDLVGHVLEQENWDVLSLPAIAEDDECHLIEGPLGKRYFVRRPGDVLHPEREDAASLKVTRATQGEFTFAAQFQQSPIPLGGAIIKREWLRFYELGDEPAKFQMVIQSWDTANKSGELNDFSVCTTWGVHQKTYYLLHVCRKRLDFPELKREARRLNDQFKPHKIIIEDKASGTQLIQSLKDDRLYRVTPYSPPTGSDKIMRLHAQSALFENGRVYLPKSAPWLGEYIIELIGFPGSRYADQVDSTTQALDYMSNTLRRPMVISDKVLEMTSRPTQYSRRTFW